VKQALAALVAVAALIVPARAEILERVLVKVNGEILTKTELEQRQIFALRQRNPQIQEKALDDQELRTMLEEVTPGVLMGAIDEMLLLQRGKELGLRLSDDQFSAILTNIKKENRLENEEQFQAALRQEGMTLQDLRRSIERRMIIDRVQQQDVLQKLSITEEEANNYYAEHPGEFTTPASVTLREILITIPESTSPTGETGISAAKDEEVEQRAADIRARVTAGGEDFARVASEVSDAPSKANGGLIGPIKRSELAPALQEMLAKLKPGEVTEPIRTPGGYQLIKLESSSAEVQQPFDEVRDVIADKVFEAKRRGEVEKYLARLRSEAIIEWNSDELRQMYEKQVKAERPQTGEN
jgi:peptidyl-prolyl cis-trans isomerase SurA